MLSQKTIKPQWTIDQVKSLFKLPFNDLMFQAQVTHRENFNPNEVQVSTLLSIKTGACPEDCKYCSQSSRYTTDVEKEKLLEIDKVVEAAKAAKSQGSTRFCMGAAWRNPRAKDMPQVVAMVKAVKDLGLETCMTLGMLDESQAGELKDAGLDYYNHNFDTSEEYYQQIVSTHTFKDRLTTVENVRKAGMKVCSGGILGLGENETDRASFLVQLASLDPQPESVPINMLVKIEGTPMANEADVEPFDFIRCIAVARIMMPKSHVRLSAGRQSMNDQMQSLCFLAGANSIFYGCKLLTTDNPETNQDIRLFEQLGINTERLDAETIGETEAQLVTSMADKSKSNLYYSA